MKKWLVLSAILLLSPVAARAQAPALDIGFNDTSAQIRIDYPVFEDNYGTSLVNGRFLYNDDEETVLGSLGFDFVGVPGNVPGLELGVGAQVYLGTTQDDQDFLALGIGTRVDFAPPVLGGFGLGGRIFYAPEIFSGLDAERMLESEVRLSYAFVPKVRVYLGYQNIRADFEDHGFWTIDEGIRVGFQARF